MTKSSMKKTREYLCFTKRDDSGNAIRDSYGELVPEYREEDVYRVIITDNEGIYEWCIHHEFDKPTSKGWIISDCDTGVKMSKAYRTRKEAYEHINERLLKMFINVRKTDYYKGLYYSHNKLMKKGEGENERQYFNAIESLCADIATDTDAEEKRKPATAEQQ